MINKLKKNKYQIIELIIIFIVTLLFNLICNQISGDEIWNYGFSYNIATGLIPYKDFNMVITPLFPMLGALIMLLFGKNLVIFHLFNAFICTIIFYYMKKFTPRAYYIIYAIFLFYSLPNYNVFCIMLLYILMTLEDKKSNDYLIGITLGLTFLTKQNIGIYLCIPTLFTKDIKKIIKRIIGFTIPNFIMYIYLILNNCFYEFIDYTFLGVKSFATKNILIDKISLLLIIISIAYLIYKYIKTKDIKIIYLLCFQLLVVPLIEPYHTMIAIIPSFGYFINTLKLNKKIILGAFIIFIIANFTINIYDIHKNKYTYPNITNEYKYRRILYKDDIAIAETVNYIKSTKDELYIISGHAYLYKLEANIKINKYDLLNNGNLGKNGEIKIINEIKDKCSKEKCTFLIATDELKDSKEIQYNKEIVKFIIDQYQQIDNLNNTKMIIYKNY